MNMTKSAVRTALGLKKDVQLAKFFEVSRAAVALWKDDEPIPELRQLQLRARRPDLFINGKSGIRRGK
jgi:hypothetical protein